MFKKKRLTDPKKLLYKLFFAVKDDTEMDEFLNAVLTPNEYETLVERAEIVRGLLEEKTQRDISEETGASLATISRGSREVKHGSGILQKLFERVR